MKKLNADPEFKSHLRRSWARKAVRLAGIAMTKANVDSALDLLTEGYDVETAADCLAFEARERRREQAEARP